MCLCCCWGVDGRSGLQRDDTRLHLYPATSPASKVLCLLRLLVLCLRLSKNFEMTPMSHPRHCSLEPQMTRIADRPKRSNHRLFSQNATNHVPRAEGKKAQGSASGSIGAGSFAHQTGVLAALCQTCQATISSRRSEWRGGQALLPPLHFSVSGSGLETRPAGIHPGDLRGPVNHGRRPGRFLTRRPGLHDSSPVCLSTRISSIFPLQRSW